VPGGLSASTSSRRTIFCAPLLSAGFVFESIVREFRENVWWLLLVSLREALQCLPRMCGLRTIWCKLRLMAKVCSLYLFLLFIVAGFINTVGHGPCRLNNGGN